MNARESAGRLCAAVMSISLLAGCLPRVSTGEDAASPATTVPIPAGWITETSEPLGYSISHPPEMEGSDNGPYSRLFAVKTTGGPAVNFIYVSAIPSDFKSGGEVIYNYDPAEAGMLLAAKVGESVALHRLGNGDEAQAADPFTYTRMPDRIIAGQSAKTYVNDAPFEFPPGTQEIRSYLQTDKFIYLIGGYVDATGSNAPGTINGARLDQIVSTFRLTP